VSSRQQTSALKRRFLADFRQHGNATTAAEACELSRDTPYQWRKRDQKFRAAWEEAEIEATDRLEAEAHRRAVEGVTRNRYSRDGNLILEETVYSDRLLMFLMKARDPGKYREHFALEHSGPHGGPIEIEAIDYRAAIAALAPTPPGPVGDSEPPSTN
jgi:hypothetical protein